MWIAVDGYRNMPVGTWLVYIPSDPVLFFHVATVHSNITWIGGHFGFDMPEVTHYQELPAGPEEGV